ncbi:hypothetical protein K402DRAFT_91430 [Aulographum hederae CBS 113979]|uniref:Uncharacterized protein n=1 Tax=Aulographum hederae CBS 113979 TaxID=1176131 RepID=A0A6G1GZD8_9PEZI|nr:hypothetical protein K402DRAFT_91430 [Aulographum hederae CBS 113979]
MYPGQKQTKLPTQATRARSSARRIISPRLHFLSPFHLGSSRADGPVIGGFPASRAPPGTLRHSTSSDEVARPCPSPILQTPNVTMPQPRRRRQPRSSSSDSPIGSDSASNCTYLRSAFAFSPCTCIRSVDYDSCHARSSSAVHGFFYLSPARPRQASLRHRVESSRIWTPPGWQQFVKSSRSREQQKVTQAVDTLPGLRPGLFSSQFGPRRA